jgi:hypothetical protein
MSVYELLKGPEEKELFLEGVKQCGIVYHFRIVFPSQNLKCLKPIKGTGYISLERVSNVWDTDAPNDDTEVPFTWDEIGIVQEDALIANFCDRLTPLEFITLERANNLLDRGYCNNSNPEGIKDKRLLGGESVIFCTKESDYSITPIAHIRSTAFNYRSELFDECPHSYGTFIKGLEITRASKNNKSFTRKYKKIYPSVKCPNERDVIANIDNINTGVLEYVPEYKLAKQTNACFAYNIWYVFCLCSSPYNKTEVKNFMQRYRTDIKDLTKWICKFHIHEDKLKELCEENEEYGKLIKNALTYAEENLNNNRFRLNRKKKRRIDLETIKSAVNEYVLNRMSSHYLYSLIRLMRKKTETSSVSIMAPGFLTKSSYPELDSPNC